MCWGPDSTRVEGPAVPLAALGTSEAPQEGRGRWGASPLDIFGERLIKLFQKDTPGLVTFVWNLPRMPTRHPPTFITRAVSLKLE